MKTYLSILVAVAVGALCVTGCSTIGNSDSRGAGLNQPEVTRNASTGTIAGSPDAAR